LFFQFNFIKFALMMKNRSLKYAYFISLLRGLNFIVNWLVNPRFGEDFFCANFFDATKLNNTI
jgi:hypothetical protein